jgi:GNAT superfamily N-acetyltransferase
MLIREAAAADAEALSGLIHELGYEVSPAEAAGRLSAQQAMGLGTLVVEQDGAVVGCASWSLMRVLHRPGPVGRVSMMVVTEARRGQGIGKALVRAVEAQCAALGCVLVEVTSNLRREDAHRFYEGLGYERTSARFAKTPLP